MEDRIARLNVTYKGQNGDLPDGVAYDTPREDLLRVAEESIRGGYIPGIPADPTASLAGFEIDRFDATLDLPDRLMIRPKTPFGGC